MPLGATQLAIQGGRYSERVQTAVSTIVLWGRMASCAAIGNRRSSSSYTGSRRPIANRPQINNLPHKATSGDKIREIRFIETVH